MQLRNSFTDYVYDDTASWLYYRNATKRRSTGPSSLRHIPAHFEPLALSSGEIPSEQSVASRNVLGDQTWSIFNAPLLLSLRYLLLLVRAPASFSGKRKYLLICDEL